MMHDNLRHLLEQIDPMPVQVRVDAIDSRRARKLLEEIMNTPPTDHPATSADDAPAPDPDRHSRRRATMLIGGLAAATVAAITIGVLVAQDDSAPPNRQTLAIADAGTTISSCLPFDPGVLAEMPVAFAGSVTAISDTTMTVEVDRWYRTAAESDFVDVALPAGSTSAALDGVDFEIGQRYLLTATDGALNGCGFSGLATAELESAFETAFGG